MLPSVLIGLMAFNEFRKHIGLFEAWQIPINDICNFIAYSFQSNLSHSKVKCYLAGICFFSKLHDFADPQSKVCGYKIVRRD